MRSLVSLAKSSKRLGMASHEMRYHIKLNHPHELLKFLYLIRINKCQCSMSPGWHMEAPWVTRMTWRYLKAKSSKWLSSWWYLIRMTNGRCSMPSGWLTMLPFVTRLTYWNLNTKSSGWHDGIWNLSHQVDLSPGGISSGWLMANEVCHPDVLRC